jgi:hypothetical protein
MSHTRIALLAILAAVCGVAACGGAGGGATSPTAGLPPTLTPTSPPRLPSCGTSTALLSVSPVPLSDLLGWVPLGNMSPPGHLFPTDHQYLYINNPEDRASFRQVTLMAPAPITITRAHRTHFSDSDTYDYTIEFALCDQVYGTFGHVTTLTPALLQSLGAFDQNCASNGLGLGTGVIFTSCETQPATVTRAAGDTLGTTGGQGTSFALDFTLRDRRAQALVFANQARWTTSYSDLQYTVAASDYYAEPARSAIRARMENYNGTVHRAIEPLGGAIATMLQERCAAWINAAKPTFPAGLHLAFAPDPVRPDRMTASIGTSQPGFFPGLYQFVPRASGLVNRDPAQIRGRQDLLLRVRVARHSA